MLRLQFRMARVEVRVNRLLRSALSVIAVPAAAVVLAACQGEAPPENVPIRGYLDTMVGDIAPLTTDIDAGDQLGSGFSVLATLGTTGDFQLDVTNAPWKCFSPAPPSFPNFDIEATDSQSYGVFISVSPAVWAVGSHPIDGTDIQVVLSMTDRFAVVTSGTLVLQSAGTMADTSGHNCAFTLQDVPLAGERAGP